MSYSSISIINTPFHFSILKKIKIMKNNKLFFTLYLVMMIASHSYAQFCTENNRFTNVEYFSDNEIESLTDVTYGNAINEQGDSEALKLDYYFPTNSIDTMSSRPFVLLIHGGGFVGGDKSGLIDECKEFAKRGYVTATINYRLGFDESIPGEDLKALYRAHQDANAALRYSIENASSLNIDTSWIFIGGGSAGAMTSLFAAYVDAQEYEGFYPGIGTTLGSLEDSANDLTHTFTIKGIFNNWGSGVIGAIQPEELKPMISFHGALDMVVPIDTADNGLIGSQVFHDMSVEQGVCSELNVDPTGGHVIYNTPVEMIFRIERASCFFKSVFCDSCADFYTTDVIPADCSNMPTAIVETTEPNEISIFPNPISDTVQLQLDNDWKGELSLRIVNTLGQVLFNETLVKPSRQISWEIDMSELGPGAYQLLLSDGEEIRVKPLVKI
ncbi:MAG: hypothetical protein ACI8YQ_003332 [Polaribacter sp.]|jgi:hypothetical protein